MKKNDLIREAITALLFTALIITFEGYWSLDWAELIPRALVYFIAFFGVGLLFRRLLSRWFK